MTDDPMTDTLQRTLTRHADDAPDDKGLLGGVQAGVRRRRRQRGVTVAAAAVSAAVAASGALWLSSPEPAPVAQPEWTTVIYQDIQVQVPAGWRVHIEPSCVRASCGDEALDSASAGSVVLEAAGSKEIVAFRSGARVSEPVGKTVTKTLVVGDRRIVVRAENKAAMERILEQIRLRPAG